MRLSTHRSAQLLQLTLGACIGVQSVVAMAQDVLPAGAKVKSVGQVAFTEGPVWHPDGSVYFTDVENNRIMRRVANGQVRVFRMPSGRANGLVFDLEGRLLACEGAKEGGNRRVTRTEKDGTVTVLAEYFEGKRLNSPNDITVDSKGFVFFTDPRYGGREQLEIFDEDGKAIEGVYRVDPDGTGRDDPRTFRRQRRCDGNRQKSGGAGCCLCGTESPTAQRRAGSGDPVKELRRVIDRDRANRSIRECRLCDRSRI